MSLLSRARYAVTRALIRTVGRRSDGVRTCLELGLTSGKTVDYVYRNRPSGAGLLGRAIDRWFLAHPGWEAVRERRANVERLLREAIQALRGAGRPVSLLDVASGPAGYVLSVLREANGPDVLARCRDLDERWVREGAAEAARLGLANVRFERGDAFDHEALLALRPRPTLAVASGFYDWIVEDERVRRSLALLHEVLEPGGLLVVTNQVSHPSLGLVSSVFEGFDGAPLRMKMRPAEQVTGWLWELGYQVQRVLTDGKSRYSVALACKA